MMFALAIVASLVIGFTPNGVWWPLFLLATAYFTFSIVATFDIARQEPDLRVVLFVPIVFTILHTSYGFGSLWGAVRCIGSFAKRIVGIHSRGVGLKHNPDLPA